MGTGEDDGLYVSGHARARKRRRAAVAAVGAAVVLGSGAYGVVTWFTHRDSTVTGDTGALAPIVSPPTVIPPTVIPAPPASTRAPSRRPASPRLSAVRQSSRPSPTPTPTAMSDGEIVATQVSRLLGEPRNTPSGGVVAAGDAITVANERGLDGSAIRVVSARYDLTGRGRLLLAADSGRVVGSARCTQNLRIGGVPVPQARPAVLLCWRVSAAKSVVTVAVRDEGRPAVASSVTVIDRVWQTLG